ncbi:phosphonate C-P lyase system protein PhnH [Bartonella sp. LJL80]
MQQNIISPTEQDCRDNGNFEKMMKALARPGTRIDLDGQDMTHLASAILDLETSFYAEDQKLQQQLRDTQAKSVALPDAEYIFMSLCDKQKVAQLSNIATGDLLYPETGATIFAPADFTGGGTIRLSGPGIKTSCDLQLNGIDPDLWTFRQQHIHYPLGFDLFLISTDSLVGIPRSTTIEVLSWPM